jgi:hypothetical protein
MRCRGARCVFAVLTSLVLAQTGCQPQAKSPDVAAEPQRAQVTEGGPRITFDKTVYDFGEVSSNRNYTGQLMFTNTGSDVLKISEVKSCCGAVVTLDKRDLAPGESGTLKVQYYTGYSSGLMSRQLRVFSNDATNRKMALDIKAQVVVRVDYRPNAIELLLNKDNAGCPKITITSLDQRPFSIKSFQATGATITADVDPSVEATRFVLEPKVDPQKHQAHPTGMIAISLTHPELDKVNIQFRTKPRFQLIPGGVYLLHPRPQEPSVNRVSVVNNYGEDFEIMSTSCEKGMARVLRQRRITGGYQLEVEITPPPHNETDGFTDVLNVQLSNGEKLSLKCYVAYANAAK